MAEAKTLEYYLANADELPEDIATLANELVAQDSADVEESDPSIAEPEAKAPEEPETPKTEEAEPKLLSKNGKDEIPYQVLVTERERRAQAEKSAEELRQRLADIESRVTAQSTPQAQPETKAEPQEDAIAKLAEDFPEVGSVIKALSEKVMFAEQKLAQVEQQEAERRMTDAEKARTAVQESIDSNPVLRYWQNEDTDMFAKAIEFDNMLRTDARNSHLSMGQRFERVVKTMEAAYGAVDLPGSYKPAEVPKATQNMNELTEKATAIAKEAGSFKPRTLSDIPGGTPPASNEAEKLQAMSPAQLSAMMGDMDQDQINAVLAKLG